MTQNNKATTDNSAEQKAFDMTELQKNCFKKISEACRIKKTSIFKKKLFLAVCTVSGIFAAILVLFGILAKNFSSSAAKRLFILTLGIFGFISCYAKKLSEKECKKIAMSQYTIKTLEDIICDCDKQSTDC